MYPQVHMVQWGVTTVTHDGQQTRSRKVTIQVDETQIVNLGGKQTNDPYHAGRSLNARSVVPVSDDKVSVGRHHSSSRTARSQFTIQLK